MNTNRNTLGSSHLYTKGNGNLKRNNSLSKLAILVLVGLMVVVLSIPQEKANNVLLIIADDWGADSHGLYGIGSSTAPTPTIDSLAAEGVRFLRAWSNPVCSPTRATILTGRYSFRTGVGAARVNNQIGLNEFTLPQALNQLGYRSAAIGKWHLSGDSNGGADNPKGNGTSVAIPMAGPTIPTSWDLIITRAIWRQASRITTTGQKPSTGLIPPSPTTPPRKTSTTRWLGFPSRVTTVPGSYGSHLTPRIFRFINHRMNFTAMTAFPAPSRTSTAIPCPTTRR